ncbi:butyrophilin subfamily 2 member A2-like [Rhinoderma darwinii]|uniref:butyrophilin subfamily 2 member A2-like n=1 Tax=Rhinoderma darwinii TaxID=43563 RepID=UPI003F671E24
MVLSEVSRQVEQVSHSVSDLIQQLSIEKGDLSRKMCSIQEMCTMADPLMVLKDQELHRSDIQEMDEGTRDDVHTVGDLDVFLISKMLHTTMEKIGEEIKFRGFKVPEASDISLDINTAGNDVEVSEDLKMASWPGVSQNRPDTPETFQSCQVLSKNYFSSGKHFMEVESSEEGDWCVGMCYSNIERKGGQCVIGHNDKSWGLRLWSKQYSAIHDSNVVQLPAQYSCGKVGLYLDYEGGQMSFYEFGEPMKHLYTFKDTFTEPLHVLCWVLGSSLRFGGGNHGN